MTKITLVKFLIFVLISTTALGQKIKYKDIYGLLSTKQYDQAEPFLKRFVAENENPNAYLYMGIIYQEKAQTGDVLKDTERNIQWMDSAYLFYDKAMKSIDEKELRKNKEYYTAYNRRDLRTGEFGVKLSDVQYDIEKRMMSLKERVDKVKMVKYYFTQSEELYRKSALQFQEVQKSYPGLKELHLRAGEETVAMLNALSVKFDSCSRAFSNYKSSSSNLGKTGYNQTWNLTEIKDFKSDGVEVSDFYKDDLLIWDYKKFADAALVIITKEIKPIQENLVLYDIEINKLRDKLETDSVSVKNDLTKLVEKLIGSQLKKYDPDPLPLDVFAMKIADLNYRSTRLDNINNKTDDAAKLLEQAGAELAQYLKLDSIVNKLTARNLQEDIANYQHFVTSTFTKGELLIAYLRTMKEANERERKRIDQLMADRTEAMMWLVNGSDSIPLSKDTNSRFKPLLIEPDNYTSGVVFTDSLSGTGYFYTITPNRIPDVKVSFPVGKETVRERQLDNLNSFVATDGAGQIFYVMIFSKQKVKEKYQVSLSKIYRSDGLAWNNTYTLDFLPESLTLNTTTGEVIIKSGGEASKTFDKNGKML